MEERKHQCCIVPVDRSRDGEFWHNVRNNFKLLGMFQNRKH